MPPGPVAAQTGDPLLERPASSEVAARLEQRLPGISRATSAREPVHIALIGDSVTRGFLYEADVYDMLRTYAGVFADRLTREFFYTGGVRAVNPGKALPKKVGASYGPEITLENFSRNGADAFYSLLPLTAGVFDNAPDLVLLNFGINDAMGRLPLSDYREALTEAVRLARAGGADVLLAGPPVTLHPTARIGLGVSRGQMAVLRQLATREGVAFVPIGSQMLARRYKSAEPPAPGGAFPALERALAPLFVHPDQPAGQAPDRIHPNWEGHEVMGAALADGLFAFETEPSAPLTLTGSVSASSETAVTFVGQVRNSSDRLQRGVLCPLSTSVALDIDPAQAPDLALDLAPGATHEVRFTLHRQPGFEGAPAISYLDGPDASGRTVMVSAVFVGKSARYVDCEAAVRPLGGGWVRGAQHFVTTKVDLPFRAVSPGTTIAVPYSASASDARTRGRFNLTAQEVGAGGVPLRFPGLPVGGRMKVPLALAFGENASLGQRSGTAEIVRNLGLGQRIPLYPLDRYIPGRTPESILGGAGSPGVIFRAEADGAALYLTYDITNTELVPAPPAVGSVRIDLRIDARPHETRGTLGMSPAVSVRLSHRDGLGTADARPTGTFGNGYDRAIDEKNIRTALETRGDGTRRATVVIPKTYFYNHPWALGNGNSTLGINTSLSLYRGDPGNGGFPPETTFVLAAPQVKREDARFFPQLELTEKPTRRWSVFVY